MREPSYIEAFGMQREICLRAVHDDGGNPARTPLEPTLAGFRLYGELSLPVLESTLDMVLEQLDVLRGRLRRLGDRFVFVTEAGGCGVPLVRADLRGCDPERLPERLAGILHHARGFVEDQQNGPPGTILLVRVDDGEHLFCAFFDHALIDQSSVLAIMRRIGQVYAHLVAGDEPAARDLVAGHQGFVPFARAVEADTQARASAAEFWRPRVAGAERRVAMPHCAWRPWRERDADRLISWDFAPDDLDAIIRARRATGAPTMYLLLAAISVAVSGGSGADFIPVTYHRHGRAGAGLHPLGPLWETLVTYPPQRNPDRLGRWVAEFSSDNLDAPSMGGLALVDFADLDTVMELRRFTLNVRLPRRAIPFGPVRTFPFDFNDVPPPRELAPRKYNTGIRINPQPDGGLRVSLHHDPADLHDGAALLAAAVTVVRMVADRPDLPLREACDESAAVLSRPVA
ncbi:condensation domain-containing protein [Micromonospora sp. LOL_024]|uniref:condensation domain-containing protein n=1 Tax=Micromonospora sp. LOL_024 TaxID=3345412 RepID=UPI003A8794B0